MNIMKVYITCPITHTQEKLDLLPVIESIVKEKGFDAFVCKAGGTPSEIFERDYNQLKSCDIIIAEISERSHGVGMEIGMSFCLGLKRILLIQKGSSVTKFAQGMPDTNIIEYIDIEDLKDKLSSSLELIK